MDPSSSIQPPLPQGWSEHIGPNGQPYYHNLATLESTYVRPIYPFPAQTFPVKPIQEKPLLKTHIPGTDWLRITTTEHNIFYFHKSSKKSIWVAPDELKAALEAFKIEEKAASDAEQTTGNSDSKRKADEPASAEVVTKKTKLQESQDSEGESSEEEEEEWQSKASEQLAAEAEEIRRLQEKEQKRQDAQRAFAENEVVMPRTVELSVEESKALFKALLREKDINPLHPWDTSLPKFISDPRYVLLPSVAARREAFDEYCKERARELRELGIKKAPDISDPKEGFDRLLREEVKSTRTNWTDFRKTWKKERRFYGWGRDDKEREKRFRDYLKELGNVKKGAALRAGANFFILLRETKSITSGSSWREVKKGISNDPRYDAVGSSSRREELYHSYIRELSGKPPELHSQFPDKDNEAKTETQVEDRRVRAIREREEKVKIMRETLIGEIEQSKIGIDIEEGERTFLTLLTDAIWDPRISWEEAQSQLKTDPRCLHSPVPLIRKAHLFHNHIAKLRSKQMGSLYAIFEANAPSLGTRFNALPLQSILSSAPVVRLGFDAEQIREEFSKWQRDRTTSARKAFDEMLAENSFVEFWGRLGKMGENVLESYVKVEDDDIGEVDEDKVDMKTLAKNINVDEMEKVLRHDKRYIVFDHTPDQREQWLRDYLSQLSAPKRSVHL